jgi:acylglycerol lipase
LRPGLIAVLPMMVLAGCVQVAPPAIQPCVVPRLAGDCVVTSDGYRLPLSVWLPAGAAPRAVLVALHGFNDYRRSFSGLARYLARQGVAVYAYDQRGFGATVDAGQWDGAGTLARDLVEVVKLVRQQYPDKPLYVLGDSMGAAVVMVALAAKPPLSVQGALLVAPAVWGGPSLNPLYRSVLWIAAHTVPWLKASGKGLNIVVTDNRAALKEMRADPLVLKEARLDALYGVVRLMDDAVAAAPRLHARLLVLYGERDQIIPKKAVCRVLVRLAAPHRDLFYGRGYHLLLRDREAPLVWEDIAAWLDGAQPAHGGPPHCGKQRVGQRQRALRGPGEHLVGGDCCLPGTAECSHVSSQAVLPRGQQDRGILQGGENAVARA